MVISVPKISGWRSKLVEKANELLRHNDPSAVVALYVCWFYFEGKCLPYNKPLAGSIATSTKIILRIARNTDGFLVVNVLLKRVTFDIVCY
jgi:hypothetical protein